MKKTIIDVIDYKEQDDGSALITFDMDEDSINLFIMEGLRELLKDEPYVVLPVEEYEGLENTIQASKQIELEAPMAQGLFEAGVIATIKRGVENV